MSPANCCKGAFLFHRFKGLEHSVRTDIKTIKDADLIPADIPVHGYVYEVRCSLQHEANPHGCGYLGVLSVLGVCSSWQSSPSS